MVSYRHYSESNMVHQLLNPESDLFQINSPIENNRTALLSKGPGIAHGIHMAEITNVIFIIQIASLSMRVDTL